MGYKTILDYIIALFSINPETRDFDINKELRDTLSKVNFNYDFFNVDFSSMIDKLPGSIINKLELSKRPIFKYLQKKIYPTNIYFYVNTEFLYKYLESSELNKIDKIKLIVDNIVFNILFTEKRNEIYFEKSFSMEDFKDYQLSNNLYNTFIYLKDNQIDSFFINYALNIRNILFNFVVSIKSKYLDYLSINYFIKSSIIALIIYIIFHFLY